MGFDIGSIAKIGVGIGATAFGGPIAGGLASSLFGGLMGAAGAGGQGGVDQMTSAMGNGAGLFGGGMQPQIAQQALSLFKDATTPDQKSKLLDVAIYALGGQPGAQPGGMSSLSTPGGAGGAPDANDPATANAANGAGDTDPTAGDAAGADGTGDTTPADDTTGASATGGTSSTNGSGSGSGLSVNGNSVDTGRYTVSASADGGGTVNVKDNQTGKFINVTGDPHVTTSDGDKADFQKNGLSIKLPDGTSVNMKPTPVNSDGKSYVDSVMVEKGGQAVTMNGLHAGNVTTSQPQQATHALDDQYMGQGQTVLKTSQNDIGQLWMTDAQGRKTTEITSKDHETDLDGKGGALNTPNGNGGASGTNFNFNPQLLSKLGQVMQLTGSNVQNQGEQQQLLGGIQSVLQTFMAPAEPA